jgi:uncharacterized protein YeaO (DUF488 family)
MFKTKRIYDSPEKSDGLRILVDRLWPRGISKSEAHIDEWMKDIAPSDELRRFYGHDISKWDEFRKRYSEELSGKEELIKALIEKSSQGTVTLIFAAKDSEHSNAAVLKEFLGDKL